MFIKNQIWTTVLTRTGIHVIYEISVKYLTNYKCTGGSSGALAGFGEKFQSRSMWQVLLILTFPFPSRVKIFIVKSQIFSLYDDVLLGLGVGQSRPFGRRRNRLSLIFLLPIDGQSIRGFHKPRFRSQSGMKRPAPAKKTGSKFQPTPASPNRVRLFTCLLEG